MYIVECFIGSTDTVAFSEEFATLEHARNFANHPRMDKRVTEADILNEAGEVIETVVRK